MKVAIVGGGVCGLTLALALHERGVRCEILEAEPDLRELGVGISLLPHGAEVMRELGVLSELQRRAVEFRESCFFNRHGQLIYRDPATPGFPQLLIHRADLQTALATAVRERLGSEGLALGRRCAGVSQDSAGAVVHLVDPATGEPAGDRRADVVIGCDGIHSRVRRHFYPREGEPIYSGTTMWRGVTRHPPILSGGSHARIGTVDPGKMVIYPIRDHVDDRGRQLMNWVAEVSDAAYEPPDWTRPGRIEAFLPRFMDWTFDWLDVPDLVRRADVVLEFPMSDRDPVDAWAFERVALAGDAAHPMIPRGSNGAMQAILDARVLADRLAAGSDPVAALRAYEAERLPRANRVVLTNRSTPPDYLIQVVEERTGFQPFDRLEDVISRDELTQILDGYKRIAGYDRDALASRG
jgi:2-polyprenyl-6-methoxyphenol hydroxylase-like FAD-dependent oxidoreductase